MTAHADLVLRTPRWKRIVFTAVGIILTAFFVLIFATGNLGWPLAFYCTGIFVLSGFSYISDQFSSAEITSEKVTVRLGVRKRELEISKIVGWRNTSVGYKFSKAAPAIELCHVDPYVSSVDIPLSLINHNETFYLWVKQFRDLNGVDTSKLNLSS